MSEEQAAIATELPAFLEELKQGSGVAQDFRVGLITTSVYRRALFNNQEDSIQFAEAGRLRPVPGPNGEETAERFIEDEDPALLEKFRPSFSRERRAAGRRRPSRRCGWR
jgi:hypothetical protein